MLKGIGVSEGCGIGKAIIIKPNRIDYSARRFSNDESEKERLNKAIEKFTKETNLLAEKLRESAGSKEAEILEGHIMMINDPFMLSQIEENINNGIIAEKAVETVCNMFIDMFSGVDDDLTKQRASDVKDIKDSILNIMLEVKTVNISEIPKGSVLVAKDFTPSMTSQIKKENVSAIIGEVGGVTSHSAILARAMGIPAILSVAGATESITDGETLIADGFSGKIIISPNDTELSEYTEKQKLYLEEKELLKDYYSKPAVTKSGNRKFVYANIAKAEEVQNVLQNDGEGIGLFRTEFLFMDRNSPPDEQEQYEAYSTVAKTMNGKEIIIRTLDIGGDKAIDYLKIEKEDNPFLGHRGIRYCLDNTEIFKTQLKAILRASIHGNIKIMFPMITTLQEVKDAKALMEECKTELKNNSVDYKDVPIGVMIETPSAALISDLLAKEVSFFSIGTNDLTGYTMAVDRGNTSVAHLYDHLQPSVLKAIEMTIRNAKSANIPVGMCGEAASDKRLIPMLVKWGLDEFSVSSSAILKTKKEICECE